jgi:hypothetical protein
MKPTLKVITTPVLAKQISITSSFEITIDADNVQMTTTTKEVDQLTVVYPFVGSNLFEELRKLLSLKCRSNMEAIKIRRGNNFVLNIYDEGTDTEERIELRLDKEQKQSNSPTCKFKLTDITNSRVIYEVVEKTRK